MQKFKVIFLIITLYRCVGADTLASINNDKLQAVPNLESAFAQSENTVTVKKLNNISLSQAGINVSLNNQWQLVISSNQKIKISQISITINGITVANKVDFDFSKTKLVHYTVATNGLQLEQLKDYTFIGFCNQILASEYLDYQNFVVKRLQVTLTWSNEQSYNKSTTNLLMVYVK